MSVDFEMRESIPHEIFEKTLHSEKKVLLMAWWRRWNVFGIKVTVNDEKFPTLFIVARNVFSWHVSAETVYLML